MQELQLYISGTRVDLFKDESVSMTQTIQNVKDISKIFTEFTQSFTVPASKINNILFKHYYNFDISGGFDARDKVSAEIQLNFIPFKKGFIRLEGVEMQKNKPYAYKITFFGETVNLKDLVGEDDLSDIFGEVTTYDRDYDYGDVRLLLISTPTALITPLITHTRQLYYNSGANVAEGNLAWDDASSANGVYWSDLKYALRLYEIIQEIQTYYSITFSTDFFTTTNLDFYNLYLWLHRKKGDVEPAQQVSLQWQPIGSYNKGGSNNGPTTTAGYGITLPVEAVSWPNILLTNDLTLIPNTSAVEYSVRVLRGSVIIYTATGLTGQLDLTKTQLGDFTLGTYSVQIASTGTINFSSGNVQWEFTGSEFEVPSPWADTYTNAGNTDASETFRFITSEQIPKIKVLDFLTGLFKMFNLTAYVDEAGTIVIKTLDSYYTDSTTVWTIDEHVDIKKSKVNVALPFKEIQFYYKGLKTFLSNQYTQLFNKGWGTEEYFGDANFDGPAKVYKVQLPFEHLQYERLVNATGSALTTIQWGWFVNDNKESYFGSPLIFYNIFQSNVSTSISVKNTATSNAETSYYNIPSNSRALTSASSTSNINFFNETNEYTEADNFSGTLFSNYYEEYISNVFNINRRLTKVTAYLPLKMIYNLKLNDKISLNNKTYKINSVKTNLTTGKSDFELLNVV
tara:strand:- start:1843 stop:3888 length:2046 start_codon:yes stop_codon:yes gene_type:complete